MSKQVLQAQGISKCFYLYDKPHQRLFSLLMPKLSSSKGKEFWALNNINVTLERGETLGIIGRNGAGKSTLLQIICGTLTPTSGKIALSGRVAALLELGAGFNQDFTGRENIYMNAAIYGLSRADVESRIDKIVAFAEIGEFIDRPVKVYSSGMFVRLAFSIIAHVDADVLVIDEALAVGDALFSQKCMRFLDAFKKDGSIIFVSHDSGAVSQLCSKVIWLHEGRVMLEGDAKTVTESYMEFLYGEIQGDVRAKNADEEFVPPPEYVEDIEDWYDPRQAILQNSTIRNDIQVLNFDASHDSFGTGKVAVDDVCFRDDAGRKLSWVLGGHAVTLEIILSVKADIDHFIVGFLVKNRLGQVLFGDNSLLFNEDGYSVEKGKRYTSRMRLLMPYLAEGEYILSLGIASGTQKNHIQHCWINDALVFSCHTGHVVHGLFGVPVKDFLLSEQVVNDLGETGNIQ